MDERFQRDLVRGSLDLMVLSVLADGASYGYLIQQRIRTASDGRVKLEAGTLYPLLHRLESDGAIRSKWDRDGGRRRKWYDLTAAGRRRLLSNAAVWEHYRDCVQTLLKPAVRAVGAG